MAGKAALMSDNAQAFAMGSGGQAQAFGTTNPFTLVEAVASSYDTSEIAAQKSNDTLLTPITDKMAKTNLIFVFSGFEDVGKDDLVPFHRRCKLESFLRSHQNR
jgi:hypothetical protein